MEELTSSEKQHQRELSNFEKDITKEGREKALDWRNYLAVGQDIQSLEATKHPDEENVNDQIESLKSLHISMKSRLDSITDKQLEEERRRNVAKATGKPMPTERLITPPEIIVEKDGSSRTIKMDDYALDFDLQEVKEAIEKLGPQGALKDISRGLQSGFEKSLKERYIVTNAQTTDIHEQILDITAQIIRDTYTQYGWYK